MMYPMYYDYTYILVIIGVIITALAAMNVKSTYAKYSSQRAMSGKTAKEVARAILNNADIYDVRIARIAGDLTDNYNPSSGVVSLSETVHDSSSIAAIGVAAHECGHVLQHYQGYAPIKIRSAILPVVNIGSKMSFPVIIIGMMLSISPIITFGIILFSLTLLFQLVTLPVEFNASSRALKILESTGTLTEDELKGAKAVLTAAALTYVAAAFSTLLQLLRLVMINGRRNRD